MRKKKVKISKVEINIGDKTIELSLKEAEELREILNDTFGKTINFNPSPTIIRKRSSWENPLWTSRNTLGISTTPGGTLSLNEQISKQHIDMSKRE